MTADQIKLAGLFKRQPVFFYLYISRHYPLSFSLIILLENEIDLGGISYNENINFSVDLILAFEKKWSWQALANNKKIKNNSSILGKFMWIAFEEPDEEEPEVIASDESYHVDIRYHKYTLDEIEAKKNEISWSHLSSNELMKWDYSFLEKYKEYFWFGYPSDETSLETDCLELYHNEAIPWSVDILLLFEDKLFKGYMSTKNYLWNRTMMSAIYPLVDRELIADVLSEIMTRKS